MDRRELPRAILARLSQISSEAAFFLPTDAAPFTHSLEFDITVHPTIDRYKLLEQIGKGDDSSLKPAVSG